MSENAGIVATNFLLLSRNGCVVLLLQTILETMIKKYYLLILSFFIFFCFGCRHPHKQGGIIFSFDDNYIKEWYDFKEVFKKYDIKATLFIAHPHLLDTEDYKKLKLLEKEGHEIACHGYHHLNSMDYIDSFDVYVEKEIKPSLAFLQEHGFQVYSFAYPFGKSTDYMDSILLTYFSFLRKATYNINDTSIDAYDCIYVSDYKSSISNAMGIDYNYNISIENLEKAIQRAVKNNEILFLYAHQINDSKKDYSVDAAYIEKIFQLCKQYNIQSLTPKDIQSFSFNK